MLLFTILYWQLGTSRTSKLFQTCLFKNLWLTKKSPPNIFFSIMKHSVCNKQPHLPVNTLHIFNTQHALNHVLPLNVCKHNTTLFHKKSRLHELEIGCFFACNNTVLHIKGANYEKRKQQPMTSVADRECTIYKLCCFRIMMGSDAVIVSVSAAKKRYIHARFRCICIVQTGLSFAGISIKILKLRVYIMHSFIGGSQQQ